MGYRLNVDGKDKIELKEDALTQVQFLSVTPNTGNARATDLGLGVKIWGKINFSLGAELQDATVTMAQWAVTASDQADCYRKAVLQVVAAGQVVREYTFPNAFVVGYDEELDDENGVGQFCLHIRQKKDLNPKVELKGNFAV